MTPHEEFEEALAAHAAGRLDAESRRRLEAHLASCDQCAEVSKDLKELSQSIRDLGSSLSEPHPSPEEIRECVQGAPGTSRKRIEAHIQDCATCELEAGAWRRQIDLNPGLVAKSPVRVRSSILSWPGLAAALVAGIVLGGGLVEMLRPPVTRRIPAEVQVPAPGLTERPPAATSPRPAAAPMQVYHLPPPVRGGGPSPVLRLRSVAQDVTLELSVELPPSVADEDTVLLEVSTSSGRSLWSSTIQAKALRSLMAESEAIAITVPSADLPEGPLELRLTDERRAGSPLVARIPFVVRRSD